MRRYRPAPPVRPSPPLATPTTSLLAKRGRAERFDHAPGAFLDALLVAIDLAGYLPRQVRHDSPTRAAAVGASVGLLISVVPICIVVRRLWLFTRGRPAVVTTTWAVAWVSAEGVGVTPTIPTRGDCRALRSSVAR